MFINVVKNVEFVPGRWWSLFDRKTNALKAETSDPREILMFYCEGDKIFNTYVPKETPELNVPISFETLAHYVDSAGSISRKDHN